MTRQHRLTIEFTAEASDLIATVQHKKVSRSIFAGEIKHTDFDPGFASEIALAAEVLQNQSH